VQVLFGVDLDVAEGEVLALLGTNGAGKSTLLRAVSGLLTPTRGVVRLDGRTITFSEPSARVGLGVVQVPGGKAVFPSLTVADNLLAGAHRYGWDRKRTPRASTTSSRCCRGSASASTSGPARCPAVSSRCWPLGKALLLEPRLLLVDELSLGLAPVVVADLLAVVERLKERGTTMVLVEQSLNVALAVADRAVFMEKGTVRFSGPAAELLERPDLARAVFLGGGDG
jgi:ABC-type branched-subunit amino acid transport system ATPase component